MNAFGLPPTSAHSPAAAPERIIVVGVGNVIRTDDGLGVHALRELSASDRLPDRVRRRVAFIDAGTAGLTLAAEAADASHVLVLDAVDANAPAGTLVSLNATDLALVPRGSSVHQIGIADWLTACVLLNGRVPEVRILGVQPDDTGWGTGLTPAVQDALERLVEAAVEQLNDWVQ